MDFLNILILSAIEGATEFLPISSTAHLIIFSKILKIQENQFHKLFEVFIQSGAILSVIFLYRKLLVKDIKLMLKIFISFLPTGFFGFLFYKLIKNIFFESTQIISFALIVLGIGFLYLEQLIKKNKLRVDKKIKEINFKEAFLIGLFQSLAIIPGVSRAGIVIIAMMVMGFQRRDSALYSFLLAVPTILSASIFDLYKSKDLLINNFDYFLYLSLGFFLSFVFALLSVKIFINYLKKNSLSFFGFYRIILGVLIFFLLLSKDYPFQG